MVELVPNNKGDIVIHCARGDTFKSSCLLYLGKPAGPGGWGWDEMEK